MYNVLNGLGENMMNSSIACEKNGNVIVYIIAPPGKIKEEI